MQQQLHIAPAAGSCVRLQAQLKYDLLLLLLLLQATDAAAAAYCPSRKELCETAGKIEVRPSAAVASAAGYRRSSSCLLPQPQGAV
jgi:hypothetical protein